MKEVTERANKNYFTTCLNIVPHLMRISERCYIQKKELNFGNDGRNMKFWSLIVEFFIESVCSERVEFSFL